ncbi:MAG: diguanylate cyclase and metal dependent phosphohydrolase [Anaerocolumna sp.]|jgi:diguanylate cyclase (GGDEF)-like protein/PAS domain S-box-containing protein|nr:diguanylate cyclase and metal dependent phosphohydrolase [Anaerocolumna sp.]
MKSNDLFRNNKSDLDKKILEGAPIGYANCRIICDESENAVDFEFLDINHKFEEIAGVLSSELIGKKNSEVSLQIVNSADNLLKIYEGCAIHGVSNELQQRTRDGKRWYKTSVYSLQKYYFILLLTDITDEKDITERKKAEEQLFNEKEQFKTTLFSVGDGVIATDEFGNITVMNPVAEKLTEWSKEEAVGKPLQEVFIIKEEHSGEICVNPVDNVLKSGFNFELPYNTLLLSKSGKEIPIEDSAASIKSRNGNTTGVVIVFRDCTEKKERLKEIEFLSFHDHLTGLYNRRYLEDAVRRLDTLRNLPFTFITIDVNGLKLTNDAFGHEMGDQLLKTVADIIRKQCRKDDIIARIGGDEFAILLPKTDIRYAEVIKRRLKAAASETRLDSIIVSLAVGYEAKTKPEEDMSEIQKNADGHMYKDKIKYGKTMRSQTIETVLRNINLKYDSEQIHTERVSEYCEAIGRALHLNEREIFDLKTAGILHDIGKITVPFELLNKSGKLSEDEFSRIKRHPEISYQILKGVDEYAAYAEVVLHHHERFDGLGYPKGLKGDEIPLHARIISIADAYEAMTAHRAYKKPKSKEEAVAELWKCAGTHFDPEIIRAFVEKVLN